MNNRKAYSLEPELVAENPVYKISIVKNKNITPDRDITANIGYKISILIPYLVKTKLAFVPPNPNELLITEFISCSSIV